MTNIQNSLTFLYLGLFSQTAYHKYTKIHLISPQKQLLKPHFMIWLTKFFSLNISSTRSDNTLSRGMGVGWLHYVFILYQYPDWSNFIPANFQYYVTPSIHDSLCRIYLWIYSCYKPQVYLLVLCSQSIINS